ncbi:MAG: hypothetical protein IJ179_00930 [Oscillospiraceae bacterium]|nr:hypothetical protein [Oscillospiraceae bacterium]
MQPDHEKNRIIVCRSCGADYSADLANCPYCGTMNLPAAETEYMGKLEHMRNDLEGLGGLAGRETKRGFRSMRRKLLLGAVLLALVTGVLYGVHVYRDRADSRKAKEEYLWQREAFAQMDAYYTAGDYESLLACYLEAQEAEHQVWQYKHSTFCDYLQDIAAAQTALREFEDGYDDPEWLFREEVSLYRLEYLRNLSEEERGALQELRAPLLEDFEERFQLTEEELTPFRRMLEKDGYIPFSECERFLKERGQEN